MVCFTRESAESWEKVGIFMKRFLEKLEYLRQNTVFTAVAVLARACMHGVCVCGRTCVHDARGVVVAF